ncbi:MAG: metallophosphoesterase family protein [Pirellulales bacterium]
MKRAILSDIHGNLEALEAVLEDISNKDDIDKIYCLGDVIGYGPNPRECLDYVREFDLCILGNHDQAALFDPEGFSHGAEQAIFWTRNQLEANPDNDENVSKRWEFLSHLPRNHMEGDFMFVHGSARNPLNEYVFPEDVHNPKKLEKIFALVPKYCFQGHTHVPGVFVDGGKFTSPVQLTENRYEFAPEKVMVNVGSVGQPRDGDPRSSYLILEDDSLEFCRVEYDVKKTVAKIFATDELNDSQGHRLLEGR